jgi:Lamin Tail Domain
MQSIRFLVTLVCVGLVFASAAAHGASSDVVISQLYAGGGNSGATFTNDFVELLNRGSSAVDLSGWTVQYATAAGTSWQATALSGSLQPGRYYLVQLASSASIGSPLPSPDATGTTNLAASGGKVALVRDAAELICGASAGSCSPHPLVADLIGYGSATDYEGAGPAPALGSTTAAVRANAGCTDTNVTSSDFAAATPAPRNTSSPAAACTTTPPTTATATAGATVDLDVQSMVSIALDHPTLSFNSASVGTTPAALPERVTVLSNDAAGYVLTVHRSSFTPADLPLGLAAAPATGRVIGPSLAGGATAQIPVPPASDLQIGSASAQSAVAGDVWPTSVGFTAPLPVLAAGHYATSITFTVIGR